MRLTQTLNAHSDEQLLDAYFEGDAQAFTEFFGRHSGRVVAYAKSKGMAEEIAREISQESFLRLHRSIHRYEAGRPALAWFFTIVHNCLIDAARKVQANARRVPEWESPSTSAPSLDRDEREEHDLHRCLDSLPQEQRDVMRMRAVEELSFKEISTRTGKTDAALRKIFERTRSKLQKSLSSQKNKGADL